MTRNDLEYMTDVEAALRRRGHPLAALLTWAVLLLVGAFLYWADHAIIDEVTRGNGRVIPSRRVQEIQNLEGGILREILVAEGQVVNRGDILLRIDNEAAQSFFREAYAKSLEHRAAIARLTSEVKNLPTISFPEELLENAPLVIADQRSIHAARKQKLRVTLRILESQVAQKTQEIREMENRRRQLSRQLALAVEQRDIARPLVEKQVYPKVDFLQLEQSVLRLKTDIDSLGLNIPRTKKAADEIRERIEQQKILSKQEALEEIGRRRVELTTLMETLAAGQDRVTRTDVRSPVRGTIKRININTIGGVIRPGESILEIVPLDDSLLIEARIRPADIAFLHPDQEALVKLSAYDFSIYGGLTAKVEQISADTISEPNGETFYQIKLRTDATTLRHAGEDLPIIPGMTASVDILTGKKSILDYLLKPILKARHNALRER